MSGNSGNGHVTRSAVALGQTRTKTVHVTTPSGELQHVTVFDTIDAGTDPDVAARLLGIGAPLGGYTDANGNTATVQTSIIYHDAKSELFVLVLSPHDRHRELRERIALLERLDAQDGPVPRYIKDFAVVFGGEELAKLVERRRERTTVPPPMIAASELETTAAELAAEARSLDVLREAIAAREELVARSLADIDARIKDLDRREIAFARQVAGEVSPSRQIRETQLRVRPPSESPMPDADFDDYQRIVDSDEAIVDAALDALLPLPGFAGDDADPETNARAGIGIEPEESTGAFQFPPSFRPDLRIPAARGIASLRVLDVAAIADDPWLGEFASARNPSRIAVIDDTVRLVVRVSAADNFLRGAIDLRITLQRLDAYPVVTMLLGAPEAIAQSERARCFVVPIDIADELDRAVLAQLARDVSIVLDVVEASPRGELATVRRCYLNAPLAENVGFIMHAADDQLRSLQAAPGGSADFLRGVEQLAAVDFDLFGTEHPEHGEFRDAKLTQLGTANQVRRAIAIAARFSKPTREDYLVCVRGVPLAEWRMARRIVLERAVQWGLWMGAELAQVAVSEGFAHSRRDLVTKMLAGFAQLRRSGEPAFDLDDDVAEDNQRALVDEAAQLRTSSPAIEVVDVAGDHPSLPMNADDAARRSTKVDSGVHLKSSIGASGVSGPIVVAPSEMLSSESSDGAAAGSIERPRFTAAVPVRKELEQLLADLDVRAERMNAAVALCELADPRAIDPIMTVVTKMSRSEAVRVLGMMVRFGTAAESALRLSLSSTKGFIRHGGALALALLRTDNGANDVIELLLREPTEIWREIARAIGQIGPAALMPLASQLGRLGDAASATARERVSWAMAHVGVRGGKPAIEALSNGVGVVAPVAQHALTLMQAAARDEVRVGGSPVKSGTNPGREVTVNRAFSKRFFEALEQGLPDVGQAELDAMDASEQMEMLDEGDLIDEEAADASLDAGPQHAGPQDEPNELDDGDLLPA